MNQKTILIVDNNSNFRFAIRQLVKSRFDGAVFLEVEGQPDAIAILDRQPHAVVITSIHLAVGNGISLSEELSRKHPHIPVIIITATDMTAFESVVIENSASYWLSKQGTSGRELLRVVDDCLRRLLP